MTGFGEETLGFLETLRANNTRAWFEVNRRTYNTAVRDAAKSFATELARCLEAESGSAYEYKVYRIHRDLRFSKDKTPYNTHVHMSFWTSGSPATWMLGLEPGKLTFGAGEMSFAAGRLKRWREQVSEEEGGKLADLLGTVVATGCRLPEPELKRVPAPYEKDHPQAELLRRKGLTIWRDTSRTYLSFGPKGPVRCREELRLFEPVVAWLNNNLGAPDT